MGSKFQIIDEGEARSAGKIDRSIPVVPPLDLEVAVPVPIPSSTWKPVPCTAPPAFLTHLVEENYSATHRFEERFQNASRLADKDGDQVGAFHAATNSLGIVIHAITFAVQESNPDPAVRFLTNKIENAWLDYNAHAIYTSPGLELRQARALIARVGEFAGEIVRLLPDEKPIKVHGQDIFTSAEFTIFLRSALAGTRFAKVKGSTLSLEWGQDPPISVPLGGSSPQVAGKALCSAAGQVLRAEITVLESLSSSSSCSETYVAVQDAIRAKFPGNPCRLPQFYISHHFTVQSTHARDLPLEASSTVVYDKALQPGEVAWVMIKSWKENSSNTANVARGGAFADTPLPEARETFLRLIREPILEECGFEHLPGGTLIMPEDQVPCVPQLVQDKVNAQTRSANDYRVFTARELPSLSAAEAVGNVRKLPVPTQALGESVFEFRNEKSQPLHVVYVAAQKTYTVAITCTRVGVSCWDDAGCREMGPEKLAGFLAEFFTPALAPENNPVLAAFQQANEQRRGIKPVSFEVALFQPVAAPPRYFERVRESYALGDTRKT